MAANVIPQVIPAWFDQIIDNISGNVINHVINHSKIAELESIIKKNENQINELKSKIVELTGEFTKLKSEHQSLNTILQTNKKVIPLDKTISDTNLISPGDEKILKLNEKINRLDKMNNIVIMGLPESDKYSDKSVIIDIINTITNNNPVIPKYSYRFGKTEPRPIRVVFPDQPSKLHILKNRPLLYSAHRFKNICIKNDLTHSEIQQNKNRTAYRQMDSRNDESSPNVTSSSPSDRRSQNNIPNAQPQHNIPNTQPQHEYQRPPIMGNHRNNTASHRTPLHGNQLRVDTQQWQIPTYNSRTLSDHNNDIHTRQNNNQCQQSPQHGQSTEFSIPTQISYRNNGYSYRNNGYQLIDSNRDMNNRRQPYRNS
jgi:hypothetical protein